MSYTDTSDLRGLAADLGKVSAKVIPAAAAVVAKGALNVKEDWRQRWSGFTYAPGIDEAVTYDLQLAPGRIGAEVGPDKDLRQGALGNLLEYGSVNNAPIPGGLPAAEAEEPRFTEAVAELGESLL